MQEIYSMKSIYSYYLSLIENHLLELEEEKPKDYENELSMTESIRGSTQQNKVMSPYFKKYNLHNK
jgi:hypothetical protein